MNLFDIKGKNVFREIELSERELSDVLFKNWDLFFQNIILIKREFSLKGQVRDIETGGRIDFFGYNKLTQKFVIVEIKNLYNKNIRSQIFDYADFIEDNFNFITLQSREILPEIKPIKNSFELILIAKKFKPNDYSRIGKYEYPAKLITYRYFEKNKITLDIFDNSATKIEKKENKSKILMPINTDDFDEVIKNFWNFFRIGVSAETILANKEYRIEGPDLYLSINKIYGQYHKSQFENSRPFVSLNQLKELLTSIKAYKGRKKSIKFGKQVTSAYVFDLLQLKSDYEI
jgi:hypothetical protein